jgi:hypothetical protein
MKPSILRRKVASCLQCADRSDQLQPRPYCPLGVVLMCLRIAEVHKHTIPHVLRYESAVDPTRSENITVTWRRSAVSILAEAEGAEAAVSDIGATLSTIFNSAIARSNRRR